MKPLRIVILITALTVGVALAADGPITGFGALGNNLASGDWFTVVDISDTSASANGTNKKILTSDVGLYYISDTAYSSAFNGVTDKAATKNAIYDYLHLADADDDGKIDVIDTAAAGFPSFNSSGAFVASRSVAEGAAIDVTNGDGASGNPTVAFDSTEAEALTWGAGGNASNIWSFNLSGTDPIITFSSGVVNVSTGTLQQGGVDVLTTSGSATTITNKTIDASATGMVLKFKSLPQFTSPLRVDGTGCTIGTTVTAVGYGLAAFSGTADEAANYAQFRIIVPGDWDTSVTPRVRLCDMIGADTAARTYRMGYLSSAASTSATAATGTPITVTVSADASGASGDVEFSNTGSYTDLTGWAPTPGQMLIITVARDGDSDASTVASTLIAVEIEYGVSQ